MNFFTDNSDLQFVLRTADVETIAALYENFSDQTPCDYAPRCVNDARDSYRVLLELAGDIAGGIIAPRAEGIDRDPCTVRDGNVVLSVPMQECLTALRRADFMGCLLPRQYGGLNLPHLVFTMMVEIISRADASVQNIFALQGVAGIIETFADEQLKEHYLPLFANGFVTGAMALTEDEAGSDLQNIKLRATHGPDGTWRLHGVKRFITNGGADILLVLARSEPESTDGLGLSLFLCEGGDTVVVRRLEDKLGIKGSPTCEVSFHNTPAHLIGERQRGLVTYVLYLLNGARLATAAQSVGIAEAAYREASCYAGTRKQYGRTIDALPPVAAMLVNMKIAIEAGRALACETASIMDRFVGASRRLQKQGYPAEEKKTLRKDAKRFERQVMLFTSLAKYYCSEMSVWVTSDAMQVMGGSGYMRDYAVERYYRDARITTIYEGTSQLQVVSAFRGIVSGTFEKYLDALTPGGFPKQLQAMARKLRNAQDGLYRMVEDLTRCGRQQYIDQCSRHVVDCAADIVAGSCLLRQARFCRRKQHIARIFINRLLPRQRMLQIYIRQAEKSLLKNSNLFLNG